MKIAVITLAIAIMILYISVDLRFWKNDISNATKASNSVGEFKDYITPETEKLRIKYLDMYIDMTNNNHPMTVHIKQRVNKLIDTYNVRSEVELSINNMEFITLNNEWTRNLNSDSQIANALTNQLNILTPSLLSYKTNYTKSCLKYCHTLFENALWNLYYDEVKKNQTINDKWYNYEKVVR